MKFLNVPIVVEARKGVPRRIRWGRRTYTVRRLLDFWILQSRWWAREEKRVYFRIETDQGVMEVYRGEGGDGGSEDGVLDARPTVAGTRSEAREASEQRKGQQRKAPAVQQRKASGVQQRRAPAVHPGGHPPFVEGDTHTRELRQTESPYRPDAAAVAGRRFSETHDSRSTPASGSTPGDSPPNPRGESQMSPGPNVDPGEGPPAARSPELLQTSGEVHPRSSTSSSGASRETGCRWVLSKVID